jgi:nucleotide-binding universal stress UspA family protein
MTEFKHILCPIDFSDASRHALDQAIAIARWYESHITALHVIAPTFTFEPPILFAERGNLKALPPDTDRIRARLDDWLAAATTAQVPSESRICEGRPAESVLAIARSLPANLIVMGSHGHSGFERLVLGSVTEKVLRNAACPVLTAPPRAMTTAKLPFRRILCAVDFSEPSLIALRTAFSMAEEADARLIVLHVVDRPDDASVLVTAAGDRELLVQVERQAAQQLESLITDESRVWSRPETKVAAGKAYREILVTAEDMVADLIVIGVHGRNAIGLSLFGSTTNQVVRRASCPVLTIRATHEADTRQRK